jgi:hypothetical protein
MKVAAFAMSVPHVSATISSVSDCVPISIPLLTKINNGISLASRRGWRVVRIRLMQFDYFVVPTTDYSIHLPEKLRWYRKQENVHISKDFFCGHFRTNGGNILGKLVILEISGVTMVDVEVLDKGLFPSPHVHFVLRVAEMGGKTRAEVTCTKNQHLGTLRRLLSGEHYGSTRGGNFKQSARV